MWAHLPKSVLQKFEKQRELFLDVNNWEKLRDILSRTKLPCIPYLGESSATHVPIFCT